MELLKILRQIKGMKKNMKLSRDEIVRLQRLKFEKIVEHALKDSKFYREYYKKNGITMDNFRDVPLKNYPVIDKEILRENFNDILCVNDINRDELEKFICDKKNWSKRYKDKYIVITSSGSTGSPAIFVYDKNSWTVIKALLISRVGKLMPLEFLKKHRVSFIGVTEGSLAGVTLAKNMPIKTITLDISDPIDKNINILNEFQPDILTGYSSSISALAIEKLNGKLDISPQEIICSADSLSPEKRRVIKTAFDIEPVNFYAASEALGIASQVLGRDEMFLFEDFYKVEVIDFKGEEVSPGEIGSVVLTNFFNYTLPLIRYKMEDQVKKSTHQDLNFNLVDGVIGRVVENFIFEKKDGQKVEILGPLLAGIYFKGVKKIQFIQEDLNTICVKYMGEKGLEMEKEILQSIEELLDAYNLKEVVDIKLQKVTQIPLDPVTGKFKEIIPLKVH